MNNKKQVSAIQRYKIGYHSDEWGVRSLSPSGIYDDAGPWVRYEDHAAVITAIRTQQPAPGGARYEKELEDALRERDEADDYIDTLLDDVLGADRAEWSSAYGRADALEEVRERINAPH